MNFIIWYSYTLTKAIFILPSISRGLEFWSVSHTSICKNSESNIFKNKKFSDEIPNNWPKDILGTNLCKTFQFC